MAGKTVNPTRMELTRLKGRLRTARRGHKLLKDKRDELMKQFLEIVRRNRTLRAKVEQGLKEANDAFTVASAVMGPEMLEQSLLRPQRSVSLDVDARNIMSVNVPVFTFHTEGGEGPSCPTASPRPAASWTRRWRRYRRCSPICWSWRRWRNPCSCWRRISKRPAAASTRWNM